MDAAFDARTVYLKAVRDEGHVVRRCWLVAGALAAFAFVVSVGPDGWSSAFDHASATLLFAGLLVGIPAGLMLQLHLATVLRLYGSLALGGFVLGLVGSFGWVGGAVVSSATGLIGVLAWRLTRRFAGRDIDPTTRLG